MPKINIRVVANAKQNKVVQEEGRLKIYLTAPAVDGKANKALIEVLSKYYHVKKRQITITSGLKSRNKIIEIQTALTP